MVSGENVIVIIIIMDGRSQIKVHTDERTHVRSQCVVFPDGHPSQY